MIRKFENGEFLVCNSRKCISFSAIPTSIHSPLKEVKKKKEFRIFPTVRKASLYSSYYGYIVRSFSERVQGSIPSRDEEKERVLAFAF